LAAALLVLQAAAHAAAPAGAPAAGGSAESGLVLSVMSTAQLNFDKLGIGAGYMGGGPYLDEKGARRDGLHASLSIAVQGEPKLFSQPDVREGQALEVAGYRILVEKINPGPRGTVVLRLWSPPKAPPARKNWLLSLLGL